MYKIPEIASLNDNHYKYKNPSVVTLTIQVQAEFIELDITNVLFTKCKKYEKRVVPPGIYIYKILGIIDYSDGVIDSTTFDGVTIYNVRVSAYIFKPEMGDILIGCKILKKQKNVIILRYIDNSVMINVPNVPMELYNNLREGNTVNIIVKSVTYSLDRAKYMIIHNKKQIYTSNKIINSTEDSVEFIDITDYTVKTLKNPKRVKTIRQVLCIGGIIFLWNLPFGLRYIKYSNKTNYRLNVSPKFMKDAPEPDFNIIQEYLTSDNWTKHMKFYINPYELLRPNDIYYRRIRGDPKIDLVIKRLYDLYSDGVRPVSRAYYKLYEILHVFSKYLPEKVARCVTLGDAPGGFAQACGVTYPKNKEIVTVSLANTVSNRAMIGVNEEEYQKGNAQGVIPYSPVIIKDKSRYKLDNMALGDGNLMRIENLKYLAKTYNDIDIVAGDAALEYSDVSKEVEHFKLTMCQLVVALGTLRVGGTVIVKIYKRETVATKQLFFMVNRLFRYMFIYKPKSSRPANTEGFVIFAGFGGITTVLLGKYFELLEQILSNSGYVKSIFPEKLIPDEYNRLIDTHNIVINNVRCMCHYAGLELQEYNPISLRSNVVQDQINNSLGNFINDKVK